MPDFYTHHQIADLMESHQLSQQEMVASARNLGSHGKRMVQLWAEAAEKVDATEATQAGLVAQSDAIGSWGEAKPHLVAGLDALAAGTGMTRQQILDDIADEPPTNFG